MADIFGDADLFAEFEKQRPASNKILKQKLDQMRVTYSMVGADNNDVPDCGLTDGAECGETTNSVHNSKLEHLENEVHRLTMLNIFFENALWTWMDRLLSPH